MALRPLLRTSTRTCAFETPSCRTGVLTHETMSKGQTLRVPLLPAFLRRHVLDFLHSAPMYAHLGCRKTLIKVRTQYYWKRMAADGKEFVRTCKACQMWKTPQPKRSGQLQQISATRPFERLASTSWAFCRERRKATCISWRWSIASLDGLSRTLSLRLSPEYCYTACYTPRMPTIPTYRQGQSILFSFSEAALQKTEDR